MGRMLNQTIRYQKATGVYNTPLGWAAREAVASVERDEEIARRKKKKKKATKRGQNKRSS